MSVFSSLFVLAYLGVTAVNSQTGLTNWVSGGRSTWHDYSGIGTSTACGYLDTGTYTTTHIEEPRYIIIQRRASAWTTTHNDRTASTRQHGPRALAAIISKQGRGIFPLSQTSIQADHVRCTRVEPACRHVHAELEVKQVLRRKHGSCTATRQPSTTPAQDTDILAHYGPGQYELHQLIGTVIGFDFDEDGDMSTMLIRFFVGEYTHPTTTISCVEITLTMLSACRWRGLRYWR